MTPPPDNMHPETGEKLPEPPGRLSDVFLPSHRRGALDIELAERFAEVTKAVILTGKPGNVSVTFKIEPQDTGGIDASVSISDSVKVKIPEAKGKTMFWVGDDYELHDSPQKQTTLEFKNEDYEL